MSLLNRSSSSACMAGSPRPGEQPRPGLGVSWAHARGGASELFGRLRGLLGVHVPHLDGGVGQSRGQIVESQVPRTIFVLEGDADLGPPGLLVVTDVSLNRTDELHHFLVVHGHLSFVGRARVSRSRFALMRATRSSSRGSPCIHGGASPCPGKPWTQKSSPPKSP